MNGMQGVAGELQIDALEMYWYDFNYVSTLEENTKFAWW